MNKIFEKIPELKFLEDRNSPFISNINKMVDYASNVLKKIEGTFYNYTNHDIEHSFSVIKYMCNAVSDLNRLSDLEITAIIYTGLLHDIGMAVFEDEIDLIKTNKYKLSHYNFERVYESCNKNEKLAMQEIIRPIHGKLSKEHILQKMNGKKEKELFLIPNTNSIYFCEMIAEICVAHNEEFEWIEHNLKKEEKLGIYELNSQYIAMLLRLGDLLDIDSTRTPDYLYKLINPQGISNDEWKQHFIITNTNKIVVNNKGLKIIEFFGNSENPETHRKLLEYIDWIKKELENDNNLSNTYKEPKYQIDISTNIHNLIKTKGFTFSTFKLSLDYKEITKLLMGENIYNDKKYGLREILQNSIDACKLMQEESKTNENYSINDYAPNISILIDNKNKTIKICDNGIGMSFDIMKKYFLNIGVSYYNSDDCKYRGYKYLPIGNYGIGFLSCFMLSNTLEIKSKRFDDLTTTILKLEKNNEYVIIDQKNDDKLHFTEIQLDYNVFMAVFKTVNDMKEFINKTFIDSGIKITIIEHSKDTDKSISTCSLVRIKEETDRIVRLDKYLNDIIGYVDINKNINFFNNLDSITSNNYIFQEITTGKYNIEILDISNLIVDNELSYFNAVFIPREDKVLFEKLLDALGDIKDVLNKMSDLEVINVYYNSEQFYLREYDAYFNRDNDTELFSDYSISKFLSDVCKSDIDGVYIKMRNVPIIDIKEKEYLCFKDNGYYSGYYNDIYARKIFIRDVLIHNFNFELPAIVTGLKINEAIINVINKNVIPDISRSNLNVQISKDIKYAIGKAIHLWLYENMDLSLIQKALLKEFINLEYSGESNFISIEYDGQI